MRVRFVLIALLLTGLSLMGASAANASCVALCPPPDTTPPSEVPPPTTAPPATPQPQPEPQPQPQPQVVVVPSGATRLLTLINQSRAEAGVGPMAARGDVAAIAIEHSKDMAAKDDIWHNDAYFTAANKARLGAKTLGENVAMNTSIDDAHARLMRSAGHRANILNPVFTVVGIGVAQRGSGSYFVTENFVQPVATTSGSAPAPKPAAKKAAPSAAAAPSGAPDLAPAAAAPVATTDVEPTTGDTVAPDAETATTLRRLGAGTGPSDANSASILLALALLGGTGAGALALLRRKLASA